MQHILFGIVYSLVECFAMLEYEDKMMFCDSLPEQRCHQLELEILVQFSRHIVRSIEQTMENFVFVLDLPVN